MTNFNKSFNFRNGVQVDVDKFIVRGSLVGIGTSIPTERLEVTNGNAKFNNLLIANNQQLTGIGTFNEIRSGNNIAIQGSSGVVTATAFYGNGATLSNLPTSQWVDVNEPGIGFTSIYAQGNVGIATTSPFWSLQIGGNPERPFENGVGINSNGNIYTTGIISAFRYAGNGIDLTSLNASSVTEGTLPLSVIPVLTNSKLPDPLQVNVITATTFNGPLVGIASTSRDLISTANISIQSITAQTSAFGISTISTLLTAARMNVAGIASVSGSIGVGTTSPLSKVHILDSTNADLQVTSSLESQVLVGRSLTKDSNIGGLKFGNSNPIYRYSNTRSLDIINYDLGSINSYLHYGTETVSSTGVSTGSFNWIYAKTPSSNPLMTLTYDGKLGIAATTFGIERFRVNGIGTITQDLYIGQNLFVPNATNTVLGPLNIVSGITTVNGNLTVTGELTAQIGGNSIINVTSGISTFNRISVATTAYVAGDIAIGNTNPLGSIHIGNWQVDDRDSVLITSAGIGIRTTSIRPDVGLDAFFDTALFQQVGIGTTSPDNPEGTSLWVGKPVAGTIGPSLRVDGNTLSIGIVTAIGGVIASGGVVDGIGSMRSYPQNSQSTSGSAYTLRLSDVGRHVLITNVTNGIIVPDNLFSAGQYVVLVNNTTNNCNIDKNGGGAAAVIRVAGDSSTVLPQVLGAYGVATLLCVASNTFVLYGQGVS